MPPLNGRANHMLLGRHVRIDPKVNIWLIIILQTPPTFKLFLGSSIYMD